MIAQRVLIGLVSLAVSGVTLALAPAFAEADTTSTAVSCSRTPLPTGQQTTCTATVNDADLTLGQPPGSVNFSASPGTGAFTDPSETATTSCSLSGSGSFSSSCQLTFTPATGGDYSITASYTPDRATWVGSTSTFAITAVDQTATSFNCLASTVSLGDSTTCTATLSDPTAVRPPTGTVTFSSAPTTGTFGNTSICQWQASTPGPGGSATCQVTFSPSAGGPYQLTASYSGDTTHAASNGSFGLSATTTLAGGGPGSQPGRGSVTVPVNPPPGPGALAVGPTLQVSARRVAALVLGCTGGVGATCAGSLKLTARVKVTAKRKGHKRPRTRTTTVTFGSVRFSLTVGSVRSFAIRLPASVFRALMLSRRHRLNGRASATGGGHLNVVLVRQQPKPKKPRRKKKR
jgi:hypothetical protein